MYVNPLILRETEARSAQIPRSTLARSLRLTFQRPSPTPGQLVVRESYLTEGGASRSPTEYERLMGTNDLVDEFYLLRALVSAHPVCRVVLRSASGRELGWATGFMVSPRLMLTNWHVFPSQAEAANAIAEFNYVLDIAGDPEPSYRFRVRPDLFFLSNQPLDFALAAVEPASQEHNKKLAEFGYHRLIGETGKISANEWMTIVQHPGGQRRQFAIRENQLLRVDDQFLWYFSDTAPGSSGSPVFNDSFQVVALHHSGKPKMENGQYVLKDNRRVPDLTGIQDSDIVWEANEGVRVSQICSAINGASDRDGFLTEFRAAAQAGDVLSKAYHQHTPNSEHGPELDAPAGLSSESETQNGAPGPYCLDLRLSLYGQPLVLAGKAPPRPVLPPSPGPAVATPEPAPPQIVEKLVEPYIDTNYQGREGFKKNFLEQLADGIVTPLPDITDMSLVSKMDDGNHILPYEHFSIVISKQRRLAIYTASNVDGRPESKEPEPGRDYSRKGLTGLASSEQEKWVSDPRIPEQHQLPDVFYNKDRKAFDKGHIVRREDVCWGSSYDEVRRANCDTFHTTNCSPQVASFNRSQFQGIWGGLENYVLKQGKAEPYSIFAGPVLSPDDPSFTGVDNRGRITVQIPGRFWKVVMAVSDGKLQLFAFLLEQDLGGVPMEFAVSAEWRKLLVSLRQLEECIPLKFHDKLHKADQAKTSAGDEVRKLLESTSVLPSRGLRKTTPATTPKESI